MSIKEIESFDKEISIKSNIKLLTFRFEEGHFCSSATLINSVCPVLHLYSNKRSISIFQRKRRLFEEIQTFFHLVIIKKDKNSIKSSWNQNYTNTKQCFQFLCNHIRRNNNTTFTLKNRLKNEPNACFILELYLGISMLCNCEVKATFQCLNWWFWVTEVRKQTQSVRSGKHQASLIERLERASQHNVWLPCILHRESKPTPWKKMIIVSWLEFLQSSICTQQGFYYGYFASL